MRAYPGLLTIGAILAACSSSPSRTEKGPLGIASFEVRETAERSTVIGRTAGGDEVARLDLVHGRFTMSPFFADGREDASVLGRKLDVKALGQRMQWETEGFDPTMQMPAHPRSQTAVDAFLRDPHARAVLEKWAIGFQGAAAAAPRYPCRFNGTNVLNCSRQAKCPTVNTFSAVPNTCGNTVSRPEDIAKIVAWRLHQRVPAERATGTYYQTSAQQVSETEQSIIAQWCPTVTTSSGTTVPAFYAEKTCPDAADLVQGNLYRTACGQATTPGACRGCASYEVPSVDIVIRDAGWSDDGVAVSELCVSRCGDGVCDLSEDCASCAADCGCTDPATCGGGGTPGLCGCTPLAACPDGYQCGTVDDGCGGTLDCADGLTCEQIVGKHWECDEASHACCKHGDCK